MAYKTPEQMLNIIIEENLLTDACMTIIDGRNEYGFHAVEIPECCIEYKDKGNYEVILTDENQKEVRVPVTVPDLTKSASLWLVSFTEGRYDIICVQYDKGDLDDAAMKQKEYLSVIAMFLDHYKIGTKTRLMNVLKYGYDVLKKEIGEQNSYELLRDCMNTEIDIRRAAEMPNKFGVRFKFHGMNEKK